MVPDTIHDLLDDEDRHPVHDCILKKIDSKFDWYKSTWVSKYILTMWQQSTTYQNWLSLSAVTKRKQQTSPADLCCFINKNTT